MYRSFGDWLAWALKKNRCDRFAREHFRHTAGGLYLEEEERDRFFAWLRQWEMFTEEGEGGEESWEEVATANMDDDEALAEEREEENREGGEAHGEVWKGGEIVD